MNKQQGTLNFWIDILLTVVLAGLTWTGALLYFVMPPGTGHTRAILGLGRHDFGQVHFYLSLAVTVLVLVHVALHWDWAVCMASRMCGRGTPQEGTRRLLGVAFSTLLLLGFLGSLWMAAWHVEVLPDSGGQGHGHQGGRQHSH